MDLTEKYRPKVFKDVVGQDEAVKPCQSLLKKGKYPHASMFIGDSGCGKTTLAAICADKLNAKGTNFKVINSADFRGIDMVRDIRARMNQKLAPGCNKVWFIDEAAKLSNDAQHALLKMLEEPPAQVYFMLGTTDPQKMIKPIQTRCATFKVKLIDDDVAMELLNKVCEAEDIDLSEEVKDRIVMVAEGSPRKVLVILQQVCCLEDEEAQLNAILSVQAEKTGNDIAKCIFPFRKEDRLNWKQISVLIQQCGDEPETVRKIILAWAGTILFGKDGKPSNHPLKMQQRAHAVIDLLTDPLYETGKSGRSILGARIFEMMGLA